MVRMKKSSKALIQRQKIVVPSYVKYKKKFNLKNKFFKHLRAYGHTKQSFSRLSQGSIFFSAFQQILPRIFSPSHYKAQSQSYTLPHTPQQAPQIFVFSPSSIQLAKAQPVVQPQTFTLSHNPLSRISAFSVQSSPCNSPSSTIIDFTTKFQARDVSFFDPNSTKKAIEIRNNCQLYHNVYSFIQILQAINTSMLRQNLKICLLNKADRWYIKLSHTVRLKLKEKIEQWCKALESQFQPIQQDFRV